MQYHLSPEAYERNLEKLRSYCVSFLDVLQDALTQDILLNPDGKLWCLQSDRPMRVIGTIDTYRSSSMLNTVAACLGKELTADTPYIEGEFPLDGSRFSGQIPPIVPGPAFSIRKPAAVIYTLEDYVARELLDAHYYDILKNAVRDHLNIVVVGDTGSGKTTFLNALLHEVSMQFPDERICISEDTGELQCTCPNSVKYHTTPTVSHTDILKIMLRMRPKRVIAGEVRDHAALDLLDMWLSGHSGGFASFHAKINTGADGALMRLHSMVSRNPYAPRIIEEVIGEAVDIVVNLLPGHRVKEVIYIHGYKNGSYLTEAA